MAVACFMADGVNVTRNFDPPKRASLRAWYNAATGMIGEAPKYEPRFEQRVTLDRDTIIFHQDDWTLLIARNKRLKG
jgi:hypothetical protein